MKTTFRFNFNHLENSNFLHFVSGEIYFCRHGVAIYLLWQYACIPTPAAVSSTSVS